MKFARSSRKLSFTREGKVYVFLCLAIGVASINTGSNLLFLLLSVMLSIIISSGILSETGLRDLKVERLDIPKAYCNELFLYRFEVENKKKFFPAFCINIREEEIDGYSPFVFRLNPGDIGRPFARAVFMKRGIHNLQKVTLESTYPFGFFKKSKTISLPGSVMVLPLIKNVPEKIFIARREINEKKISSGLSRRSEEYFFGLKEYRIGENPRHIYWESLAKYKEPMIKEYEELAGFSVDILLDLSFSERNF